MKNRLYKRLSLTRSHGSCKQGEVMSGSIAKFGSVRLFHVLFPLTPALSLGERENRLPVTRHDPAPGFLPRSPGESCKSGDAATRRRIVGEPQPLSPLSEGEGQGEGEVCVRLRAVSNVGRASDTPLKWGVNARMCT
jgi:hypothetical protein